MNAQSPPTLQRFTAFRVMVDIASLANAFEIAAAIDALVTTPGSHAIVHALDVVDGEIVGRRFVGRPAKADPGDTPC